MRNGDIINEYIAALCVKRLSEGDVQPLMKPKQEGEPDIALLDSQSKALVERKRSIARLIAAGDLSEDEASEALGAINAELRDLDTKITKQLSQDPLADAINAVNAQEWWDQASLARKRVVVQTLLTVEIRPVGKGNRILTLEAAAKTVDITWKR